MDNAMPGGSGVPVLTVSGLGVSYLTETGRLDAVRNVSLRINHGESYGLVGESGSGKSTLARAVVRFLPRNARIRTGQVYLQDLDLLRLSPHHLRRIWGARIGMVDQSPSTSVNPAMGVGAQIAETARAHLGLSQGQAWKKAIEMLTQVGMPDPEAVAKRYAHQMSGGMLQRVLIATALVTKPELLIMDEPTTALDVTTQAIILDLLHDLIQRFKSAVLYITHNLGVVARLCDRVGVMYAGELVEEGAVRQVFQQPRHPYTLGLLGCVPRVDTRKHEVELRTIPGYIPRLDDLPFGCVFAPRCAIATERCRFERPSLISLGEGQSVACWNWSAVDRLHGHAEVAAPPSTVTRAPAGLERRPPLMAATGIVKYFESGHRGLPFFRDTRPRAVKAVDDISIQVDSGATLGIVGESGCGKTTLVRCIAGLEPPTQGQITLDGEILFPSVRQRQRQTLKKLQMVFQNPDASLNPQRTVAETIARPLVRLAGARREEVTQRIVNLLRSVHLPDNYMHRYPHELSGGEKQRVAIARAIAAEPRVILCDEPISSLDVSVQASLMNLLSDLQRSQGITFLFVSHDLAAVRHVSDWIVVVYLGRLCEVGRAEDVFCPPLHPYTEALMSAIPIADPGIEQHHIRLEGSVPSAIRIPGGCRFHTRCPRKIGMICENEEPQWQEGPAEHRLRCHIPLGALGELQQSAIQRATEERT